MTPKRGEAALEVLKDVNAPTDGPPSTRNELPPSGAEDGEPSLREYLDVVLENRLTIAIAAAVAVLLGGAYAFLATPVYESDALVQVEDKKGSANLLGDLGLAFGETSPAETEIEILRSRAIVGGVVDELGLDVVAEPRRFPVIGRAVARRHSGHEVAPAFPGFGAFGWGGERIAVGRLDIPDSLLGETLTLVALGNARFTLRDGDGAPLLDGEVGKAAAGGDVEIFVTELVARKGTEFRVEKRRRDEAVNELQEDIRIAEKGKKTGILRLSIEGEAPGRIAAVLDALSRSYLRQNVERKSAEAEKTLEFLEEQLPVLKSNLEASEGELETYRSRKGSVDVSLETQAAVTRSVEIEKAASEIRLEHAALRQRFTEDHPTLVALSQKLRRLDGERGSLEARLRKLPEAELESARRMRDVKVANELYLTLLNKAQELKVVKEGTIGNVRILDAAVVPVKPVAPRKGRVLVLSVFLGLAAGIGVAFARRALDQGVEDPDAIERATGIGVHAAVPHSAVHEEHERRNRRDGKPVPVLADHDPKDLAVESLRSLRTSLQFALFEAKNNVIAISGPAPGVGKSFISVNLAHLLGESGKKVLVVDGDLRRGHLHRFYGTDRAHGLSDIIGGNTTVGDAVRDTRSPNVHFLPTGTIPPNPAELLGSERFQRTLAELSSRYDLVLIDTPPILAVTDAALVGRHAGVNLLVVRAGAHPVREIVAALRVLGRGGIRVHGLVMNGIRLDRGLGRRNAYHYQYRYE